MKRSIYAIASLLSLLIFSTYACAQSIEDYYTEIRPVQPTQTGPGKVEVIEVFSYACPHCYEFEPVLQRWLEDMPENAEFRRLPATFYKDYIPLARAYYTAQKLGILDRMHQKLFEAVHKERRDLFNDAALKAFFMEQGVDGKEFSRVYNSMEIQTKLKQAEVMSKKYKIPHVPGFVINGKYFTSPSKAQGYDNLERVMDVLIERESTGS